MAGQRFSVAADEANSTLGAFLRSKLGMSWRKAKNVCRDGKVRVGGRTEQNPAFLLAEGATVELMHGSTRPGGDIYVLHADRDVVVVDKPPQLLTVPAEELDETSLVEELPLILRRKENRPIAPLQVVHRLDRDTSGILVFARNAAAHRHLQQQFRVHSVERRYLALVYGQPETGTIATELLPDRGDGLRGSLQKGRRAPPVAKRAVTHITLLRTFEVPPMGWVGSDGPRVVSLVACRLETGRQHQIRIHLSEAGHPVVGERVYIREYRGGHLQGYVPPEGRVLLHAARLGFMHPRSEKLLRFERDLPADFAWVLQQLERASELP